MLQLDMPFTAYSRCITTSAAAAAAAAADIASQVTRSNAQFIKSQHGHLGICVNQPHMTCMTPAVNQPHMTCMTPAVNQPHMTCICVNQPHMTCMTPAVNQPHMTCICVNQPHMTCMTPAVAVHTFQGCRTAVRSSPIW
jgi:hypothetical protein